MTNPRFPLSPVQQMVWDQVLVVTERGAVAFAGTFRVPGLLQSALGKPLALFVMRGLISVTPLDPDNQKAGHRIELLPELRPDEGELDDAIGEDPKDEEAERQRRQGLIGFAGAWARAFPNGACYFHGPHPPGFVCEGPPPAPACTVFASSYR